MRIASVEPFGFRNLHDSPTELGEGVTVIHGPNGSGKTNLLEAIYFGLTGHACRGSTDRDLIAHGQPAARVELDLAGDEGRHTLLSSLARDGTRRQQLDGAAIRSGDTARPPASVFLPDRLQLVKGPPAHRRAHLDRFVAALWPSRADLRQRFGRALAQRNALVSRVRAGLALAGSLAAWDGKLAAEAEPLVISRREAVAALEAPFATAAGELGLPDGASVRYRPRAEGDKGELLAELTARRDEDLGRAYMTFGPQLDEVVFELGERPLRRFGSQGQQRLSLLALLFAEREALIGAGRPAPLMLLDDVVSELDPEHRGLLLDRLDGNGQAVITATEAEAVPTSIPWTSLAMAEGRVSPASGSGREASPATTRLKAA